MNSTVQQLHCGIGSANGSTDVPSVVMKHKSDDNDLLSSSRKSKGKSDDVAAFNKLSSFIKKHSNSLVVAAQIAAILN